MSTQKRNELKEAIRFRGSYTILTEEKALGFSSQLPNIPLTVEERCSLPNHGQNHTLSHLQFSHVWFLGSPSKWEPLVTDTCIEDPWGPQTSEEG